MLGGESNADEKDPKPPKPLEEVTEEVNALDTIKLENTELAEEL